MNTIVWKFSKRENSTLVSLPTVSNQDRELDKEAVLSAYLHGLWQNMEKGKATNSSTPREGSYNQTHKRLKLLDENKETKRAALKILKINDEHRVLMTIC